MLPCLCPPPSRFVFFRLALDQMLAPPPPLVSARHAALEASAAVGGVGCCSGEPSPSSCTLVSQASGWCSGIRSEGECHRARTEARPCVWHAGWCTKGFLAPSAGQPSCPLGAPPVSLQPSHFDAREAASADFVDVRHVVNALGAKVAWLRGGP